MATSKAILVALILAVPLMLVSQDVAAPVAFDVASIKPTEHATLFRGESGRFFQSYIQLFNLIRIAYGVDNYQVVAPIWMYPDKDSHRYDVDARYPRSMSKDQVLAMARNLLAERFGLKVHEEIRSTPVYALVVGGPNPPRLKESQIPLEADGSPDPSFSISSTAHGFELRRAKLSLFAGELNQYVGRPVIDMTGIEGKYDFSVRFERELSVSDSQEPSAGSILAVVRDMGFRLEKRNMPMKVIVVDHAEKTPTPN